jgi:membrane associated rhomboid family serine protease
MSQASVGFQCPECTRAGARSSPIYTPRTLPGAQPIVTWVLIGLNVAVFVAQLATIRAGENPVMGMGAEGSLVEDGAIFGPAVAAGEWWRLVTSGFLHLGLLHVGMNMFVLYMIGPQLERLLGGLRFLGLYVASLLAGALGVMLVEPNAFTAGASGAIYGLLGAAAAYQLSNHINIWRSGLGTLILINLAATFMFGFSAGGHFGGLIGGGAVGYLLFQLEQREVPAIAGFFVAVVAGALFALAAIAVAPATAQLRPF